MGSILLRLSPEGRFEPHAFTCVERRHARVGDTHRTQVYGHGADTSTDAELAAQYFQDAERAA
jgi:hypothetical protein